MQKACRGRTLQFHCYASKWPQDKTGRRPPARVASHRTLSLAQSQHVLGTEGPMKRWGWLTSLASERVATRPSAFPSEKWPLWKRLIQTPRALVFGFCPRRSSPTSTTSVPHAAFVHLPKCKISSEQRSKHGNNNNKSFHRDSNWTESSTLTPCSSDKKRKQRRSRVKTTPPELLAIVLGAFQTPVTSLEKGRK